MPSAQPVTVSAGAVTTGSVVMDVKGAAAQLPGSSTPPRTPLRVDLQVCFTYVGTALTRCTWEVSPRR